MTPSNTASPLLVIGVGNEWRGDDAVGRLAARALLAKELPGVAIIEHSGDGANLMETWDGAAAVILIDAAAAGGTPGTIYRLDAHQDSIPAEWFGASSHLLGVGAAVELARALGQLPPRFVIFGIEGSSFAINTGLSSAVAASLPALGERVIQEISNMANVRSSP